MKIILIADTYLPLRTSGAIQIRDLSRSFVKQGHTLTLILPSTNQKLPWLIEDWEGIQILRLKSPRTKGINYLRRTINEFTMSFFMLKNLKKSPLANEKCDCVIWYSPSIFLGPVVNFIKKRSNCKGYLILRDIFPDWAVDMGILRRGGLSHRFFNIIVRYQYSLADIIGVQSPGNLTYFNSVNQQFVCKLEILQNWLDKSTLLSCPLRLSETKLAGRKILIYAGNMGVAQGLDIFFELALNFLSSKDIGFLYVGRGSEFNRLKLLINEKKLENVLICDEIEPDEIADLYSQCVAGIVALDSRHKSHNIPGKFLTYIQNGLPVLANVNNGNDLSQIIRIEQVGQVCESGNINELIELTKKLLIQIENDIDLAKRCQRLFERDYTAEKAATQISLSLFPNNNNLKRKLV